MQTFARTQRQPQKQGLSSPAGPQTLKTGPEFHEHFPLHLHRGFDGRAAQPNLPTHTEYLGAGLTGMASRPSGHAFSRIPIHPPRSGVVQAKLAVNQPEDEYEQEADRISEQVMRMPDSQLQRKCACGGESGSNSECAECERKKLQRFATQPSTSIPQPSEAPPIVHEVLRSPGRPLDQETRAFMEPRFGHDFSRVRVHDDSLAAESARAVHASAYTVGRDVVFAAGQHNPQTGAGRGLLAHELAHTVQQAGAAVGLQRQTPPTSPPTATAIPTLTLDSDVYTDDALESQKNINFNVTIPAGLNKRDYALVQLMKGSAMVQTSTFWGLGGPSYFTRSLYGSSGVDFNFPSWQVDSDDPDPVYWSDNKGRWNYKETSSGFTSSDHPGPATSRKPGSVYALNFRMGLYKIASLPATTTGTISATPLVEVPWQYSVVVDSAGKFTHPII